MVSAIRESLTTGIQSRHGCLNPDHVANTDHSLPGEADGADFEAGSEAPAGPDAEMTERFRSSAAD